jgi:transposase-like protein
MHRIVPGIASLEQHLQTLITDPEQYRPVQCPHCGRGRPWSHGFYERKADRGTGVLNPIPVPRYLCPGCKQSSSRLPACIAPRRWYDWARQQAVLMSLLMGTSLRACVPSHGIGLDTARRWWRWLQERSEVFRFRLLTHWSEWGRAVDWCGFWRLGLAAQPLRDSMAWLDSQGLNIP